MTETTTTTSFYITLNTPVAEYKSVYSTGRATWQYLFERSL